MPRYFLVAGVDFGTSFSKVVIREQNSGQAVVVTFPAHLDGLLTSLIGLENRYLIPPARLDDCACIHYLKMLAAHAADGSHLEKGPIKVPAALGEMRKQQGDLKVVRDLMAFYFASIMAATENFIRSDSPWKQFDFSQQKGDSLVFQLAVPTGLLDNNGATETLFRQAFIAAYHLRHTVDPAMSKACLYSTWTHKVDQVVNVGVKALIAKNQWQCLDYPEVLAAMQAVFRSPNPQQDGLYITVDVGAGTVELNAFRRYTGEHLSATERAGIKRSLDYYSLKVCPLGIHNIDDPDSLVRPRGSGEILEELRTEVYHLFLRALLLQPNNHAAPGTRPWDRARFIILGGGANQPPYRQAFTDALDRANINAPQVLDLPAATDLEMPHGAQFGRFAVAYGMSFFRPNLDQWRPPDEILPLSTLYPPDPAPPPQYGINWDD